MMVQWSVKPKWKKSIIERIYFKKDDNSIMIETGWRWGEFLVYTEDDNPPDIEAGVDIYNCDYESELVETFDGCWEDHDFEDCDDETREFLEEFFEENSWFDLEEHGWVQDDCEMIIDCDMEITRINEDGTKGESFTTGQEDSDTAEIKLEPKATWPFGNVTESSGEAAWPFSNVTESSREYAQFKCQSCDFSTDDIDKLVEKDSFVCPLCGGKVELE